MRLGIRALNDFAFQKTFGEPENGPCLVGLLNAILRPKVPIVHVTVKNPFNLKDFQEDKLLGPGYQGGGREGGPL